MDPETKIKYPSLRVLNIIVSQNGLCRIMPKGSWDLQLILLLILKIHIPLLRRKNFSPSL